MNTEVLYITCNYLMHNVQQVCLFNVGTTCSFSNNVPTLQLLYYMYTNVHLRLMEVFITNEPTLASINFSCRVAEDSRSSWQQTLCSNLLIIPSTLGNQTTIITYGLIVLEYSMLINKSHCLLPCSSTLLVWQQK